MTLWRLYKKHGIKRKAVRKAKTLPDGGEKRWEEQKQRAREGLRQAIKNKAKLIFLDEIVFSKTTLQTQDYSPSYNSFKIDQKKIYTGYLCAIAAISEEDGLVNVKIEDRAVDTYSFGKYLKKLRDKFKNERLAVWLDLLPSHIANDTKDLFDELKIQYILNPGYSPEFNPIESCFSVVKSHFKKEKLHCLVNEIDIDYKKLIHKSFAKLKKETVVKSIERS